jgi:hypothetical protein
MPSADTLSMAPAAQLVKRYATPGAVTVDPFARDCTIGTITNDLNPNTAAQHHMHAVEFLTMIANRGQLADVVIFDPPYSPRQVAECYTEIGINPTMQDTQTARLKRLCRAQIARILKPGGHCLSFGWNTVGMGHGFETVEIVMICHGGDHNDTIITVDRALQGILI